MPPSWAVCCGCRQQRVAWSSPQLEEGGASRVCSGTALVARRGNPDPAAEVHGRGWALVLSGHGGVSLDLLSHSRTICKSKAVLIRDVLSQRKEKHWRSHNWKVLFHGDGHFGLEMGI